MWPSKHNVSIILKIGDNDNQSENILTLYDSKCIKINTHANEIMSGYSKPEK